MPNRNYIKGIRKERDIVNRARALGLISFRSAGSHSPIDVIIIDYINKHISLIQCKPNSMNAKHRKEIEDMYNHLNMLFNVEFKVI